MSDCPNAYMVEKLERKVAKNGNPFLSGTVFNREVRYNACFWDADVVENPIALIPGSIIEGDFELSQFNNKPQLKVNVVHRVLANKDVVAPGEFVKNSWLSKDDWIRFYKASVEPEIEDEPFRQILNVLVLSSEKFFTAPAARSKHQNWRGGLAEHTYNILRMYTNLAFDERIPHMARLDHSVALTAITLHDLGKVLDYDEVSPGVWDYAEFSNLIYHVAGSPLLVMQAAMKHEIKLKRDRWLALTHAMLAHHGQLEWGSPVVPATAEALIIHFLDNMDAKLSAYDCGEPGQWNGTLRCKPVYFDKE